jgi:hypothetical protein
LEAVVEAMDLGELLQAIHKYITISYTSWLSSGKKVQSSICDISISRAL